MRCSSDTVVVCILPEAVNQRTCGVCKVIFLPMSGIIPALTTLECRATCFVRVITTIVLAPNQSDSAVCDIRSRDTVVLFWFYTWGYRIDCNYVRTPGHAQNRPARRLNIDYGLMRIVHSSPATRSLYLIEAVCRYVIMELLTWPYSIAARADQYQ